MGLPNKTLELIDRVERGDREAALDLVELYKPENIDDLVLFVAPEHPPSTAVFDALADALDAYMAAPD